MLCKNNELFKWMCVYILHRMLNGLLSLRNPHKDRLFTIKKDWMA